MEPKSYGEGAMADWEDADEALGQDDIYDDLADFYLVSGQVWPEGMALEDLPRF